MKTLLPVVVNKKIYGIDIDHVKEIITKREYFVVPFSPEFLIGIVNLRGYIIPCFDLSYILFSKKLELKDNFIENLVLISMKNKNFALAVEEIEKIITFDESMKKDYFSDVSKDVRFIKFFVDYPKLKTLISVIDTETVLKYIEKSNKEFYKYAKRGEGIRK